MAGNVPGQAMSDQVARQIKARSMDRFSKALKPQQERLNTRFAALGLGPEAAGGLARDFALAEFGNRSRVNQDVDIAQEDANWKGALSRYDRLLGENSAGRGNYLAGLRGNALEQQQYQYDTGLAEGQHRFDTGMTQDWNKFDAAQRQRDAEFGGQLGLGYGRLNEGVRQFDEGLGEQNRQFGDRMNLNYDTLGERGRQFDTGVGANLFGQEQGLDLGYDRLNEGGRQFDSTLPIQWGGLDRQFAGVNEQARQFDELLPLRDQQALAQLMGIAGGFGPTTGAPLLGNSGVIPNSGRLLAPNPAGIPNQYGPINLNLN